MIVATEFREFVQESCVPTCSATIRVRKVVRDLIETDSSLAKQIEVRYP